MAWDNSFKIWHYTNKAERNGIELWNLAVSAECCHWSSLHLANTNQSFCIGPFLPAWRKSSPLSRSLVCIPVDIHTHPQLQRNASYFWAPKVIQTSSLFLVLPLLDHCSFFCFARELVCFWSAGHNLLRCLFRRSTCSLGSEQVHCLSQAYVFFFFSNQLQLHSVGFWGNDSQCFYVHTRTAHCALCDFCWAF